MNKTIVLFKTELDTLNAFSRELATGFLEENYDIFWLDVTNSAESIGILYEYMKNHKVVAMIGFNNRTMTLTTPSKVNIWEALGIFCINILVDHPYWYHDILIKMPANSAVLCIDKNHMNYVSRFYNNIAISGFLPHGGNYLGNTKSYFERPIDALYVGSLYKEHGEKIKPDFSAFDFDAESVVNESIEYLIDNPSFTVEEVLEKMLIKHGQVLPDDKLRIFISYNVYVERKVSSYYREKLIASVAESGINLTIYGRGFEDCSFISLSNVDYRGYISPEEVVRKIGESKVLINSMPWFKDGSHERIFLGMLNGAVVFTEYNSFMGETFDDSLYAGYTLDDIKSGCDRLKDIINDESLYNKMSQSAFEAVINKHTWICRAKEIHKDLLKNIC